jgi:hypothetical protein
MPSLQETALPAHFPFEHLSFSVHKLPSSQLAVLAFNTQLPVCGLQDAS